VNDDYAEKAMLAGFHGTEPPSPPHPKTCPTCGQPWPDDEEVPVRVTESTVVEAKDAKKPYGDVEYADPGYQSDGKKRYPLDTEDHVRAAWSYINQKKNAAKYSAEDLKKVRAKIKAAMRRLDIAVSECSMTEAMINGSRSWDDIREMIRRAVRAKLQEDLDRYVWVYIVDITDTDLVYMGDGDKLFQCTWSLSGDVVTLGEPVEVERTYAPALSSNDSGESVTEAVREAVEHDARVMEAKGTDNKGNRIFRVRLIATGTSKNGTRYTEAVLGAAAHLYDGAKAYDHHRTEDEMRTSTIDGLVGYYTNITASAEGLDADFHVFPSAVRAAEALDAALKVTGDTPFVGFSHDVYGKFTPVQEAGRTVQEATEITAVNSVDIVARPSAGGKVTRAVAGGINDPAAPPESTEEYDVPVKREDVLAAIREASDDELAAAGLARAGTTQQKTEAEDKPAEKVTEAAGEPKDSFLGRLLIKQKIEDAGLPASAVESVTAALPDRITESAVDTQISAVKAMMGNLERAGLVPTTTAQVTQESLDKKIAALDAFFAKDYIKGYRSFREAFCDITGRRPRAFDEDFNRTILQECYGGGFGSTRVSESIVSSTFDKILGDSVTRRMVAEYQQPNLMTWRQIVSVIPVNDFRTQRIDRMGGYGTLPAVNQGQPYQPLTTPGNEEATYAITKRGGTEDLTLETIANDDIRAIQRIPVKLGLAAAQTLYRFVWDILPTNAATSYDSTALFHANHGNTDNPAVLGQSTLTAGRTKMLQQAAYGDSKDILSLVPKFLVVPTALEEIAFQLCTSAVAIPSTPAGPTDTPNIHQGTVPIRIDYYTDTNDWYLVADPNMCPTIEIGFYQGREIPELFTQADPTVGSMFDADKMTWKIRHIYSGTVLDHRGFYRGAN
jgi:hypothetical protein